MSNQNKNYTTIYSVEFVEDGILLNVSSPTNSLNVCNSKTVYIKDDLMLKILSRYIDNEPEENSNGIEDASY